MTSLSAPQAVGWANLLDRLWRVLASPRLTIILLVWVAVVLVLSAVIPQMPLHIEDPTVRSQWLASLPINMRPAVERLQPLGVFSLLDSMWLRLPLALLLAHASIILAAWIPAIWSRLGRSPAGGGSLGKSFLLEQDFPEPAQQACPPLVQRLEKAGYRILVRPDQASFVAWRRRWSWWGLAGIYLGLALVSAGLILQGWLGRVEEVNLEPGSPLPLPWASAPNLVLDEAAVTGDDLLQPADGVAVLRILAGVGEGYKLTLRLHGSRLWQGLWMTLADLRPVAEVMALDEKTGEPVLLEPFSGRVAAQERVRLPLVGDPETRFVGVPSRNVTLHVNYAGGAPEGQGQATHPGEAFSLSFFRGAEATPTYLASLHSGDTVTFDGVGYRVVFDYDAGVRLNSRLWWVAVAVGWGMTALSLAMLIVAPPVYAQVGLLATAEGSRVRLTVDVLGDEQRRHRELRALVAPEV